LILAKTPKGPKAGSDATVFMPREEDAAPAGRIKIGSILNAIYEVRRLIARGGMGEVYEGVNVNTDERVAIKVILGHLAEDPKVLAMFRREAQTLTRLSHKALVQYRVLAQEPTLGVLYIVTEYIDGVSLNEIIGEVEPDAHDLLRLTRRLAEGLGAAHDLGAIHRDMSPDNVLLPNGRLEEAKIIDFGIAKDLEASQGTIIGDGFAGKLAYVAPEQFGDFGRDIGPWTDVYSLALVLLAVASGRAVDMGTTLVEAVDRRRAKPDLSAVPQELRPVFAKMLEPDPKNRFRTMGEVVHALDELSGAGAVVHHGRPPVIIMAAAGAAVVGLVAFAIVMLAAPGKNNGPGPSAAAIQTSVDSTVRGVSCAWLTDQVSQNPNGVQVQLAGAAGDPSAAAAQVTLAFAKSGAKMAGIDGSLVKALPPAACDTVGAVGQFRAPLTEANWIQPQAATFTAAPNALCNNDATQAVSVITLTPPPAGGGQDLALFRLDDTGGLTRIFGSLAEAKSMAAGTGYRIENLGDKGLRVSLCEKTSGLKGALAIRGKAPLDLGVPALSAGADATSGLAGKIAAAGKAQGFVTQMAWYEVQGALANPAAASSSNPAASSSAPASSAHHHKAAAAEGGEAAPAQPSGGGGGGSPVF
jgi:hypothetical protein